MDKKGFAGESLFLRKIFRQSLARKIGKNYATAWFFRKFFVLPFGSADLCFETACYEGNWCVFWDLLTTPPLKTSADCIR